MNIVEFRKQYPQYDHVDDNTLSKKLHEKHYSHVPFEQFSGRFMPQQPQAAVAVLDRPSADPITGPNGFEQHEPAEPVRESAMRVQMDRFAENFDPNSQFNRLAERNRDDRLAGGEIVNAPLKTGGEAIGEFFTGKPEDKNYLRPDAGRNEKFDFYFNKITRGPVRTFIKFGKGMLLNTPDIAWAAIKKVTPAEMWDGPVGQMNLDEAMDWAMDYNPSGFASAAGDLAEFSGGMRTGAKIGEATGLTGNLPKAANALDKAANSAKLFGLAAAGKEVSKGVADAIDPHGADYEYGGAASVAGEALTGAAISLTGSAGKAVWSKLIAKYPQIGDAAEKMVNDFRKTFGFKPKALNKDLQKQRTDALKTLGLSEGATEQEIKAAFRQKAMKLHPDKVKGFEAEFDKTVKARDVLKGKAGRPDIVYNRRQPSKTGTELAISSAPKQSEEGMIDKVLNTADDVNRVISDDGGKKPVIAVKPAKKIAPLAQEGRPLEDAKPVEIAAKATTAVLDTPAMEKHRERLLSAANRANSLQTAEINSIARKVYREDGYETHGGFFSKGEKFVQVATESDREILRAEGFQEVQGVKEVLSPDRFFTVKGDGELSGKIGKYIKTDTLPGFTRESFGTPKFKSVTVLEFEDGTKESFRQEDIEQVEGKPAPVKVDMPGGGADDSLVELAKDYGAGSEELADLITSRSTEKAAKKTVSQIVPPKKQLMSARKLANRNGKTIFVSKTPAGKWSMRVTKPPKGRLYTEIMPEENTAGNKADKTLASFNPSGGESETREPWEMTKEQYRADSYDRSGSKLPRKATAGNEVADQWHEKYVREAVTAGKPVQAHILKEYAGKKWADGAIEMVKSGPTQSKAEKPAPVKITGNELGDYDNVDDLRKKARVYAVKNFAGKNIVVKSTGEEIQITVKGLRHATAPRSVGKIKAIVVIPELIENSRKIGVEPDRKKRADIKAIHKYSALLDAKGEVHDVTIVVRETKDGKKYYDHYLYNKKVELASSRTTDKQLGSGPLTGSTGKSIQQKSAKVKGDLNKKDIAREKIAKRKGKLPKIEDEKKGTSSVVLRSGIDPGVDKFIAEDLKPAIEKAAEASKQSFGTLKEARDGIMAIVEPAKRVEKKLGGDVYSTVIRGIHRPEKHIMGFEEKELQTVDMTIQQVEEWFDQFSDEELKNFMLSKGKPRDPKAVQLQMDATAKLPEAMWDKTMRAAVQEVADLNHKFLTATIEHDITKRKEYFYGNYKGKRADIEAFFRDHNNKDEHYRTTKRMTKEKVLPTVADAAVYGLKLKNNNPIGNLRQEAAAIARLEGMKYMRDKLMRMGKGKYIDTVADYPSDQPGKWVNVGDDGDPIWNTIKADPDLAKLINNLIAVNKISQSRPLSAIREVNNVLRVVKFAGSAFHLMVEATQAVADTPWRNPVSALRGLNLGFKKHDPIFKTEKYRKHVELGGGHKGSAEVELQRSFEKAISRKSFKKIAYKFKSGNYIGGTMTGLWSIAKIPPSLLQGFSGWMFEKYIPKLKYLKYLDWVADEERRLGRPLTDREHIEVIKEGSNFYGEMNEKLFGRSATTTSATRFLFLAPGFAEGNYRTMGKAATQWGYKGGFKARRSRINIIHSLILKMIVGSVGTLIATGKPPKMPKTMEDFRDLTKIDTGKVDDRGRRVMIDTLTYDKDYYNLLLGFAQHGTAEVGKEIIRRIGGMKAPIADIGYDLITLAFNKDIFDWKGDKVLKETDTAMVKLRELAKYEAEKILPISASVYANGKKKGLNQPMAMLQAMSGVRTTFSEKDLRRGQVIRSIFELKGEQEELYQRLRTAKNPRRAVKEYNAKVERIIGSEKVPADLRDEWQGELTINTEKYLKNKAEAYVRPSLEAKQVERTRQLLVNFDQEPVGVWESSEPFKEKVLAFYDVRRGLNKKKSDETITPADERQLRKYNKLAKLVSLLARQMSGTGDRAKLDDYRTKIETVIERAK